MSSEAMAISQAAGKVLWRHYHNSPIGGPGAVNRREASAMTMPSLPAESVEFSVSYAAEKCMPFVRREPEKRTFGVPAVADTDLAPGQARHLDAVAVGETQGALDPVRTRSF
jgi:hypothetical protein